MAPTAAPTPACDEHCADAMPPSTWRASTCAEQLAGGHCAERISLADGYCEATCGICVPCEKPCPTEREIPTAAPTSAPTAAPTSAPTAAPTMAPTRAPTPATCAECVDKEPPPSWAEPTCARQLSSGQCAERARMADGYCMATCGLCTPCEQPCDTEEPTAAPTKAPTMAPTAAPTPACDEHCADAMPPSTWRASTCAEQLA